MSTNRVILSDSEGSSTSVAKCECRATPATEPADSRLLRAVRSFAIAQDDI